MTTTVDARGYSCPQPVMMTRQALKKGKFPIKVLVETVTSRENVRRAAESAGYKVRVNEQGDEFVLTITK
jgi:tRNA 2-thiouridine synthesizing protein A